MSRLDELAAQVATLRGGYLSATQQKALRIHKDRHEPNLLLPNGQLVRTCMWCQLLVTDKSIDRSRYVQG